MQKPGFVSPSCKNKRGVIRVSALIPFGKCQKHAQTLCGLIVNVTSTFDAGCKACGNRHKILEDICDLASQIDASKTKVPLATVVATLWPTEMVLLLLRTKGGQLATVAVQAAEFQPFVVVKKAFWPTRIAYLSNFTAKP